MQPLCITAQQELSGENARLILLWDCHGCSTEPLYLLGEPL